MNSKLEDLMYHAGLTAQGCWDEMDSYDHTAIENFAKLIVRECAQFTDSDIRKVILNHFGVNE